jgi:hypothetical protein
VAQGRFVVADLAEPLPVGSGPYAGQVVNGGSWAALDPATGKILWQTPDPHGDCDTSYVSAANGAPGTAARHASAAPR